MRIVLSRTFEKLAVSLVIVFAATGATGCKKIIQKLANKSDAGSTTASAGGTGGSDSNDPDEQLQEKLDEYIKCLNSLSAPIHNAQKRYLSRIPKTGPTGREGWADIYTLPAGAATKCAAGITKAKGMAPANAALEAAGGDFSKYASELEPMIAQLDKYFENKDYRDDKWAKAKEVHPKLMTAFANFNKADTGLHSTLAGITKPLSQRILGKIEREDGKRFAYFRKSSLNAGRELVEAADPVGDDGDVDFNLFNSAYTEFDTALEGLSTYGASHKAELADQKKAPHWPLADNNYDQFVNKGNAFRKASKEYLRCLRDAPAKAKKPDGKVDLDKVPSCPDGRVGTVAENVVTKYNEFIRGSNDGLFP